MGYGSTRPLEGPERVGGGHPQQAQDSRHRALCLEATGQATVPEVWEKASTL